MRTNPSKYYDAIVSYIEENGPQNRASIEVMLEMSDRHVFRILEKMVNAKPKRIYRCRWEYSTTNEYTYLTPFYAVGDLPCAPKPAREKAKRIRAKATITPQRRSVWEHDTRADALIEATAGWQHNVSAKPWNVNPTQTFRV